MSGPDRIELEQAGRVLRGSGSLRVSTGRMCAGKPVAPYVEGEVIFDDRITEADLRAMTDADIRVVLRDGAKHAFTGGTLMRAEERGAGYAVRFDIMDL